MTVNCIAQKDSIALGEVMVFGKSNVQKLKEGAYSVSAVQIKNISSSVTNLADVISRSSGINIRTDGGLGSDYSLSINGMSGNAVKYFVDGMPMNSRGSYVNLSNFPVGSIDRIEVYKGVVPAHLGGDALGGAVNIITKQQKKDFIDLSISAGSFSTYRVDMNSQFVVGGEKGIIVRPQFNIDYSKNDYKLYDVEVWDEESEQYQMVTRRRFHDRYRSANAQVEFGVTNRSWADQLFVGVGFNATAKQLQTGSVQSIVYGRAEKNGDAWNLNAKYKKSFGKLRTMLMLSQTWDHSATIDTAYARYDWNGNYIKAMRNETNGRARMYRHYKRPLTVVRANLSYTLNDNHSLGLNYMMTRTGNRRYDSVTDYYTDPHDYDPTFLPSNDVLTKHIVGLNYDQTFFGERMLNSFFVKEYIHRADIEQTDLAWITHSDATKSSVKQYTGYGLGSRYTITDWISAKFSYEHAVRLPQAHEFLGNGVTVYPNLSLTPESSHNVNLGVFGTCHSADHTLYYEVGGFLRYTKDYIHLRINDNDGTAQYENVNDVDTKGVEGELRYNYSDWLQVVGNMSYQESLDKQKWLENGNVSGTYNNRIPNRPWMFGNLELTLTKRRLLSGHDKLRFNYLFQYTHWFYLTWEGYGYLPSKAQVPSQYMQNAALTYSLKNDRYNFTLAVDNIFDTKSYDNYKLQKPGRAVTAKFRLVL